MVGVDVASSVAFDVCYGNLPSVWGSNEVDSFVFGSGVQGGGKLYVFAVRVRD